MHIAALTLRRPLWLAWLSLLAALQVAPPNTMVSPRPDMRRIQRQAGATPDDHAVASAIAAGDDDIGNQDELSPTAALPPEAARTTRHGVTPLTRGRSDRGDRGLPAARRSPRAPPISVSL